MRCFRDSTDPAYREYCAEIVALQKRFTQEDRNRIVREFLSEGLNAKKLPITMVLVERRFCINGLGATSRKLKSCVKRKTLRMKSSKR